MSSPRTRFGIRFALLSRLWRRVLDIHLTEAGLTDATWVPLIHLKETGGGLTQKDLAGLVGVEGSSLVRVIDILSRQGLVERRPDATDGRARLIFLTAEGDRRVSEIRAMLYAAEKEMLMDLSDSEIAATLETFTRIERRLKQLQARPEEGGSDARA
ncbi:MarR family winged helix-turn-helix transcriptional regulator [Pseudodonghicola flavimaris]|uniref:MarR family transcriptional regulator n=1 Tax=Pseudodonghicola flavimaris TaxID=3050036 RepID=A0ABT7F0J5_9RHOB|nr:MarR family transcriptional regulator [Pseudodonghicola flavimaris]MDK3018020.1 MarR family transcriptional regulator [Pseudodonghicola flavimaris]